MWASSGQVARCFCFESVMSALFHFGRPKRNFLSTHFSCHKDFFPLSKNTPKQRISLKEECERITHEQNATPVCQETFMGPLSSTHWTNLIHCFNNIAHSVFFCFSFLPLKIPGECQNLPKYLLNQYKFETIQRNLEAVVLNFTILGGLSAEGHLSELQEDPFFVPHCQKPKQNEAEWIV